MTYPKCIGPAGKQREGWWMLEPSDLKLSMDSVKLYPQFPQLYYPPVTSASHQFQELIVLQQSWAPEVNKSIWPKAEWTWFQDVGSNLDATLNAKALPARSTEPPWLTTAGYKLRGVNMKTFQVLWGWQKGNSSLYFVNLLLLYMFIWRGKSDAEPPRRQ